MNKTELISAMAERSGLSKKDTEKALNAALETITAALATGEPMEIPAARLPVFKAGKALKDTVAL